jgi:hypothetical protein
MNVFIRATALSVAALGVLAAQATAGDGYPISNGRYRVAPSSATRAISQPALQPINLVADDVETERVPAPMQSSTPTLTPTPLTTSEQPLVAEPDSMFDGGDGGPCDQCPGNGCCQNGLWYGSVEYLLFRPRFSQAAADMRTTTVSDTSVTPNTLTTTDQSVQFPFKYQSSYRASLGYRMLNCGGDLQVTYWRLTGTSGRVSDGPATANTDNPAVSITGQTGLSAPAGDFFSATSGVTANIFDVDFAKCLSMGGPQAPCETCFCPRWDLRWSAGARIADISRFDNNSITDAANTTVAFGNVNARFVGAGPRVSLQGRRYFGQAGGLAVYAKASQSLLLGDYRISRTQVTPGTVDVATNILNGVDTLTRMVPVTDIELGATWQVAPFTYISAGWFFQCWWDLGQGETQGGANFSALDTSNILGFDGLFVRGEMLF